jgi:hypothetical protein
VLGRAELKNRTIWIPDRERGEDTIGAIRKGYGIT